MNNKHSDTITNWWESKRLLFTLIMTPIIIYEEWVANTIKNDQLLLSQGKSNFDLSDTSILPAILLLNFLYCIGTGIEHTIRINNNITTNRKLSIAIFCALIIFNWLIIRHHGI